MLVAVPVAALLKLQFEKYVARRKQIVQNRERENEEKKEQEEGWRRSIMSYRASMGTTHG